MTARLIAAAALAALLPSPVARAGSCGGGGGGSRGGGGGGHGDGVFFGGAAAAKRCEETSDVVGYRQCTRFGAWGMNPRIPHLVVEAGVVVRQFGTLLDGQINRYNHGAEAFAFRVLSLSPGRAIDTAVLSTLRGSLGLSHGLYAAAEIDLGGLTHAAHATTEMMSSGVLGTPDVRQDGGFVVDSLATVGFRGATHAGGLGVELAGGLRAVSYGFHSTYFDCIRPTSVMAYAPVAEARARGELWLSPWLTAGVTVGTSVLEQHTWMGGVYLGVHTRAFGGGR
ncbi:MAG TPA: hypothetical protein VLM79_35075 [Kofleriaceae bacterium]|nr:hypothetical protein [Kofleriaceae bacterium]